MGALILFALGVVVYVATRPAAAATPTPTPGTVTPPAPTPPGPTPPVEPTYTTDPTDLFPFPIPPVPGAGDADAMKPYTAPISAWTALDPRKSTLPEQVVMLGLSRPAMSGSRATASLRKDLDKGVVDLLLVIGDPVVGAPEPTFNVRVEQVLNVNGTNARPPESFKIPRSNFLVVG